MKSSSVGGQIAETTSCVVNAFTNSSSQCVICNITSETQVATTFSNVFKKSEILDSVSLYSCDTDDGKTTDSGLSGMRESFFHNDRVSSMESFRANGSTAGRFDVDSYEENTCSTLSLCSTQLKNHWGSGKTNNALRFDTQLCDEEVLRNLANRLGLSHQPPTLTANDKLGRCNTCQQGITDERDACQAMGAVYHNECFTCCCCHRTLCGKTFYKDCGKIYCEEDYLYCGFQHNAAKCTSCKHIITDMILQAMGKSYHPGCFRCCVCNECLDGMPFTIDLAARVYCVFDYHRVYAPRCAVCHLAIIPLSGSDEIIRVVSMDRDFHIDCYCCENCGCQLTDEPLRRCFPLIKENNQLLLLCHACHILR